MRGEAGSWLSMMTRANVEDDPLELPHLERLGARVVEPIAWPIHGAATRLVRVDRYAGGERLQGIELEARGAIGADLTLAANYSYHEARFTQYQFFDADAGAYVNVAGDELPLSPRQLISAGVLYRPPQGFGATLAVTYVGRRYLDEENIAPVGGYTRLDATLGYCLGHYELALAGTNLTNQRPPVSASEFGSESFYLLNARTLWLRLTYRKLQGGRAD